VGEVGVYQLLTRLNDSLLERMNGCFSPLLGLREGEGWPGWSSELPGWLGGCGVVALSVSGAVEARPFERSCWSLLGLG